MSQSRAPARVPAGSAVCRQVWSVGTAGRACCRAATSRCAALVACVLRLSGSRSPSAVPASLQPGRCACCRAASSRCAALGTAGCRGGSGAVPVPVASHTQSRPAKHRTGRSDPASAIPDSAWFWLPLGFQAPGHAGRAEQGLARCAGHPHGHRPVLRGLPLVRHAHGRHQQRMSSVLGALSRVWRAVQVTSTATDLSCVGCPSSDTRTEVTSTTTYPYSALGQLLGALTAQNECASPRCACCGLCTGSLSNRARTPWQALAACIGLPGAESAAGLGPWTLINESACTRDQPTWPPASAATRGRSAASPAASSLVWHHTVPHSLHIGPLSPAPPAHRPCSARARLQTVADCMVDSASSLLLVDD